MAHNKGYALIDTDDLRLVEGRLWWLDNKGYAHSGRISLHRHIMKPPPGVEIDHANGDKLDNRRQNLRFATRAENSQNRAGYGSSGYKGVAYERGKWKAAIRINGKHVRLGRFDDITEAASAFDAAAQEHHGEFAWLNFPRVHNG